MQRRQNSTQFKNQLSTLARNSRLFLKIYVTTVLNKSNEPVQKHNSAQKSKKQHQFSTAILPKKRTGQMSTYKTACIKLPVLCWLFHENHEPSKE
jgi:hypothetical protein